MNTEDSLQIALLANGLQSTLKMKTLHATVLIECGHDLNKWVQDKFDEYIIKYPHYSRRKIGDLIRRAATAFFVRNLHAPDF